MEELGDPGSPVPLCRGLPGTLSNAPISWNLVPPPEMSRGLEEMLDLKAEEPDEHSGSPPPKSRCIHTHDILIN